MKKRLSIGVLAIFISLALVESGLSAPQLSGISRDDTHRRIAPSEWRRMKTAERMDKQGMLHRTTAVVDKSEEMLRIPDIAPEKTGFTVAKTPPTVEFVVIPIENRYFFEGPTKDKGPGLWTAWGQGTYNPNNGKFYGSIGDHIFFDSRLHITEYDPQTKSIRTFPEINKACGLPIDYGDGKIHGTLDFYGGNTMYFMTYWTEYPQPREELFDLGYEGGRLLSFDVDKEKLTDFGVPMKRVSWPYHRMDRKRGLMYAVGSMNEFLCYDIKNQKVLYAGYPPAGMLWYDRCMIVDEETGCAYSSNLSHSDPEIHIIKYDSSKNRFFKMKSSVPLTESKALQGNHIRAHTPRKAKDGWFICITRAGRMFKFFPEEDRVEDLGFCWAAPPEQLYTTSIAISPDDKYIYYVPAAHGGTHKLGGPVVQYNTVTGERKALAFLFPYFYEKYGYITGGTFSVSIDEKGERLFIVMNGAFAKFDPTGGDVFGDPSVMVIHIPESERQ